MRNERKTTNKPIYFAGQRHLLPERLQRWLRRLRSGSRQFLPIRCAAHTSFPLRSPTTQSRCPTMVAPILRTARHQNHIDGIRGRIRRDWYPTTIAYLRCWTIERFRSRDAQSRRRNWRRQEFVAIYGKHLFVKSKSINQWSKVPRFVAGGPQIQWQISMRWILNFTDKNPHGCPLRVRLNWS